MKKSGLLLLGIFLFFAKEIHAQDQPVKLPRIALFAPLYLDSVFDASGNYKPGKIFPRYLNAGLEFYQGATFALDSLDSENVKLSLKVFDTKNSKQTIFKIADGGGLDSTDIIIGAVSGSEYIDLATIAKEKKIPFVSAIYPNDGGISANPYVIIVNSKLNTHLQAIYNYVLRNFGTNKLVLARRKNPADDRVGDVFKSLNASGSGQVLNMQTFSVNAPQAVKDITSVLDSTRENVIICGSLDDGFAKNLIAVAASLSATYKITLVGMPTWSDFGELTKPELKAIPILYSSAFFNPGVTNTWVDSFTKDYAKATYTNPTETSFRGFELIYFFAHLLTGHQSDIIANLAEPDFKVLTDFDFKPIHWSKNITTPDYYENKRIYILKSFNGELSKAN
jgi:ABC-type branched-subunit amino acid transport system substrate-binding protein